MAKETDSRCCVCSAIVGPGVRFCCHFCKLSKINDELKSKVQTKANKKAKNKKNTTKKKK